MITKAEAAMGRVLVVLAFAAAGCVHIHLPAKHTPAPPALVTNAFARDQRAAVLAYAATLEFDSITHGAGDRQPLTLPDSNAVPRKDTLGPIGTIFPERNTHHNSIDDLRGVGRIVARIETTGPYPKLGLPVGVSYLWVHSLVMVTRDSGNGRMIIIPADSTQPTSDRAMKFTIDRRERGAAPERQPLAQWRYHKLGSEVPWERCTKMGCCEAL